MLTTAALEASLYGNYDVYLPVDGSQSERGIPQIFIGDGEAPNLAMTPEPSSLLLLGTGILGLASILCYKKRGAQRAAQH
jgi:PEP-CTERM motif